MAQKIFIDAKPVSVVCSTEIQHNVDNFHKLFDILTIDEYKSIFFILLDYLRDDDYLELLKKDRIYLKQKFHSIYHHLTEKMCIELFSTIKIYTALKLYKTCNHIYSSKEKEFDQLSKFRKMLFSLCEDIEDSDLDELKKYLSEENKSISSAEEFFYCALEKDNIFNEGNISVLRDMLHNKPNCVRILDEYKENPTLYYLRTPVKNVRGNEVLSSSYCGEALVINIQHFDESENIKLEYRQGSDKDSEYLSKIWSMFGLKVVLKHNLKAHEIKDIFQEYSKNRDLDVDIFVCCLLSHGDVDAVYGSDCEKVSVSYLVNLIGGNQFSLKGKPKLFFIQACQGNFIPHENRNQSLVVNGGFYTHNEHLDVCVVFSAPPGYASFRTSDGSWFIQTLCCDLENSSEETLTHILKKVTDHVSRKKCNINKNITGCSQAIRTVSTLRRDIIFKKVTEQDATG